MTEFKNKSIEERLILLEYKDGIQEKKLDLIDSKLDEILQLRQKGMGAFWLASSLLGTGIIGVILMLVNWARGY